MKTNHIGIISGIMVLAALVVFSVFIFGRNEKGEYDFSHPEKTYVLSDSLKEISGVTHFNKKLLACVEDEHGIAYIFDLEEGHIKRKLDVEAYGDFEGIARVGKELYLLRSDGTLFVRSTKLKNDKVKKYRFHTSGENFEGLFYDKKNSRLLLVSRESGQYENGIPVFAFNTNNKSFPEKPVLRLKVNENDKENFVFAPSELAIHPKTGNIFVLSAADHALFVFDKKGNALYTQELNPVDFNKPEGMTFAKNGDLFISNEGQTEKPTILKFVWLQ